MQLRPKSQLFILITVFALILGGCDGSLSDTPPATYENSSFRFSYPAAWDLQEHEFSAGISMIAVEGAMDGGMILQYFPADLPMTLDEYALDFATAFSENVPVFDVSLQATSDIDGEFGGVSLKGRRQVVTLGLFGFETGYRLDFYRHEIGNDSLFLIFHYSEDAYFGSDNGIDIVRESLEFL